MDQNIPQKRVKCPECGKEAIYSIDNPNRPFCSERCRLIDLGEWIEGSFRIPGESADAHNILAQLAVDEDDQPH